MQKTQELLLILINEERTASEEFILRRLMLLDVDALTELELVGSTGLTALDEIRQASLRFAASSRAGKVTGRIYASAMEGYAQLIKQCNLAASQKQRATTHADSAEEISGGESDLGKLTMRMKNMPGA